MNFIKFYSKYCIFHTTCNKCLLYVFAWDFIVLLYFCKCLYIYICRYFNWYNRIIQHNFRSKVNFCLKTIFLLPFYFYTFFFILRFNYTQLQLNCSNLNFDFYNLHAINYNMSIYIYIYVNIAVKLFFFFGSHKYLTQCMELSQCCHFLCCEHRFLLQNHCAAYYRNPVAYFYSQHIICTHTEAH